MTTVDTAGRTDPLGPVREALLAGAREDAGRRLAAADEEAAATVARGRAEADAVRAEARAQGEADAAGVLAAERARARRRARAVVLAAQREVYDELRRRTTAQLPALRSDPAYDAWCARLRARVSEVLGEGATVAEDPDGGVVGERAGRRVSCTLAELADRVLDELGSDVEGLWRP